MTKDRFQLTNRMVIAGLVAAMIMLSGITLKMFTGGYLISQQIMRIDNLEKRVDTTEGTLETRGRNGEQYFSRLSILETKFIDFQKAIDRIDGNLEKLVDRQYNENKKRSPL